MSGRASVPRTDGPFGDAQFRQLFAGRVVTNVGDGLYFIAAMWLVYDLTGDPFYSGVEDTDGGSVGSDADDDYLDRLRGGASLLRGTFLPWMIAGAAIVNFTAGMALASMPVYADSLSVPRALDELSAAGAYGILMAAFAGGNFLGAIGANAVADRPFGVTMTVGLVLSGVLWTRAIAVGWLPATAALLVLALLPVGTINVQIAAVVQSASPEEYVGRVSSMLGSATSATIPFGSLAGGAIAGTLGPRVAMVGLGVGSLVFAAYVLAVPELRGLATPDEITLRVDGG